VARQRTPALQTPINGMTTFVDESVHNVTGALRARGMWPTSLIVFSGDNGGYLGKGGDNTPLRGGKFSDLQGGVRVPAFVTGGLLTPALRGTVSIAKIHVADWAGTFVELAGGEFKHDARAAAAQPPLPQPDSLSLAPYLLGATPLAPRTEVPLSVFTTTHRASLDVLGPHAVSAYHASGGPRDLRYYVGGEALIVGDWKLVVGVQHDSYFLKDTNISCDALTPTGPAGTSWVTAVQPGVPCTCGSAGCLFHLADDPSETHNRVVSEPDVATKMHTRLAELRQGVYAPDRGPVEQAACDVVNGRWHGFWGPWRDLPDDSP